MTVQSGGTSVVASNCVRIAGPSNTVPAPSASRANTGVSRVPPAKCTARIANAAGIGPAVNRGNTGAGNFPTASTRSVTSSTGASSTNPYSAWCAARNPANAAATLPPNPTANSPPCPWYRISATSSVTRSPTATCSASNQPSAARVI